MKRLSAVTVVTALAASLIIPTLQASAQVNEAQSGVQPDAAEVATCPAVDIVVTAGTGESDTLDDPTDVHSFSKGTNFAANVTAQFEKVSAWQTPYNASVGIFGSGTDSRSTTFLPYGESKRAGVAAVSEHISQLKSQCPATKTILVGYSQGADVAGDVAKQISDGTAAISPADLLGAYLVADPGRARLIGDPAVTTTGTAGLTTADGGILLHTNRELPPAGTVGLSGPRPDGAFSNLPGKVRHICAGNDPACAVAPDGLLATTGRWADNESGEEYRGPVASLKSMLFDGSFARATAPHLSRIMTAILYGQPEEVRAGFAEAAQDPSLRPDQAASLRLAGREVSEAITNAVVAGVVEIPEDRITGRVALDRLINIVIAARSGQGLGELLYAASLPKNHFSYTGENRDFVTIEGSRTDDWLEADMFNLIATELGDPRRAQALPYQQRETLKQKLGYRHWSIVKTFEGGNSDHARELWQRYDL